MLARERAALCALWHASPWRTVFAICRPSRCPPPPSSRSREGLHLRRLELPKEFAAHEARAHDAHRYPLHDWHSEAVSERASVRERCGVARVSGEYPDCRQTQKGCMLSRVGTSKISSIRTVRYFGSPRQIKIFFCDCFCGHKGRGRGVAFSPGEALLPRRSRSTLLVDPDPRFVKSGWAISGKMASASTARSGRKDTWREQQQKQFFWEHEKVQPTKTFILPCRAADPRGDFPLDDLQSGRTDLMCRAISSAMFFSSGVRRDVNVVLILGSASGSPGSASGTSAAGDAGGESGQRAGPVKTRAVWINGRNVRHLRPDERNVAFVLQTAVWAYTGRVAALSRRVESSRRPGKVGMHTEDGCGEQEDNGIGVSAAAMTESVRGWRRKESLSKGKKRGVR